MESKGSLESSTGEKNVGKIFGQVRCLKLSSQKIK